MRKAEMLPEIESYIPGRFRLTALIQRRIQELIVSGTRDDDLIRKVMREAAQGEIDLEPDNDRLMGFGFAAQSDSADDVDL